MDENKNKHTNLGEEYNRESMYETARDYLMEGKRVELNGKTHNSLISFMIADLDMQIDRENKYFERSEELLKAKDTDNFINLFSQSLLISKITGRLEGRIEDAIKTLESKKEQNKLLPGILGTNRNFQRFSTIQLEEYLKELIEYESNLFDSIHDDTIDVLSNTIYINTKRRIQQVEDEIKKRLASEQYIVFNRR